jgi:hypothetical protein
VVFILRAPYQTQYAYFAFESEITGFAASSPEERHSWPSLCHCVAMICGPGMRRQSGRGTRVLAPMESTSAIAALADG